MKVLLLSLICWLVHGNFQVMGRNLRHSLVSTAMDFESDKGEELRQMANANALDTAGFETDRMIVSQENKPNYVGDLKCLCDFAVGSNGSLPYLYPGDWSCDGTYRFLNITTACHWHGVTCDDYMNVVSLDLSGAPVIGTIPDSIGNLNHLKVLNLRATLFHGGIPSTIGYVTALEKLLLSGSQFSGVIPSSIGYLTALQMVVIGWQKFNGTIPSSIGYLTGMKTLQLTTSKFSGVIPTSIGYLTALTTVVLSYNKFTGVIPTQIGMLTVLRRLRLNYNKLSGFIPTTIYSLTNLRQLTLNYNSLKGVLPTEIANLKGLTRLRLQTNELTGSIPLSIGVLTNLRDLQLNRNHFSSSIPLSMCNLTALSFLYLSGNSLTSSLPSNIGVLTNLEDLEFSYNSLTGVLPSSIGYLTLLTRIDMHNGKISGIIPSSFGNLVNLVEVCFSNNLLSGPIPSTIGELTALTVLHLGNNKLTSSIPTTVMNLIAIAEFGLSTNSLTGVIPESIVDLTALSLIFFHQNSLESSIPVNIGNIFSLQNLWLSYNKLTGVIPASIGGLSSLQVLKLHDNSLTSSLPMTIGNLVELKLLQIQNNKLSGYIPTSLDSLVNLETLEIGDNLLGGRIPTNIGLLTMLSSLGMGNNSLQGSIPSSIGMLSSLTALDLSYNQLTSSIPITMANMTSLQFVTLNNNQLSSTVPSELTYLSQLKALALDHNSLGGVLPFALCHLPRLGYISLNENNMSCAPWCQSDFGSSEVPRCQDYQDSVFYDLQNSLQVAQALQIKARLNRSSSTIQSSHPFQFNKVDSFSYVFPNIPVVAVENAIEYQLVMSQFHMFGWLYFCKDYNCTKFYGRYGYTGQVTDYQYDWLGTLENIGWQYYDYSRPCILTKNDDNHCFKTPNVSTAVPFIIKAKSFYVQYKNKWNFCPFYSGLFQCGPSFGFIVTMTSILTTPVGWDFEPSPPYPSLKNASVYARALCDWHGVNCDKGNLGMVTSLNLAGLGLIGTLPTSIGLLTTLTSLDLSGNLISGSIVSSMSQLSNLRILNLNQNKFGGELPRGLWNVTQLFAVSVTNNKLIGAVPSQITSVTGLEYLYLDGNSFNDEVPMQLCEALSQRNLTVSLMNNPSLSCYQESCWNRMNSYLKLDTKLTLCVPTSIPTVTPTKSPTTLPTPQPVSTTEVVKPLLTTSQLIAVVVIIPTFVALIVAYIVYRRCFSVKALHKQAKEKRLKELPIHRALSNVKDLTEDELLVIINTHILTATEKDIDGKSALELILHDKIQVSDKIVHRLLVEGLPVNVVTGEEMKSADRYIGWAEAVQSDDDAIILAVDRILCDHKKHIKILANAKDSVDRKCIDIASKRCKESMYSHLFLHGTYDVQEGPPVHKSATSLVVFANQHTHEKKKISLSVETGESQGENSVRPVALKFMKNRDQFEREVEIRQKANFNEEHVISVLYVYGDKTVEDKKFREDALLKGYEDYPYCVAMEAASHNLKHIIDHEYIANSDWKTIKDMTLNLTETLEHVHDKGIVHGDLKPLNVLRVGMALKLTDLDASVSYEHDELAGSKYSSGYLCPEMLWMDPGDDEVRVRSVKKIHPQFSAISSDDGSPIRADPSQDIWALGCVLYYLCTGASLFHVNTEDNIISQQELVNLFEWDLDTINDKLSIVIDSLARNLLSLLLNKDPKKRPSAARVLCHPFLTGRASVRLPGEEATWDIFLSYRVASDSDHVEMIYNALTALGLKVWWDKLCLLPGQNWEEGFCKGLLTSRDFVCLSSKGAIKNPNRDALNWEKLTESSRCDNVLLEWRLALDLKERGMLNGIFPVMIGDRDAATGQYNSYFAGGCHPNPADVVVATVETKVREHLAREGLGMPYKESISVKAVLTEVFMSQGGRIEGDLTSSLEQLAIAVQKMSQLHNVAKSDVHSAKSRRYHAASAMDKADSDDLRAKAAELEDKLMEQEAKNAEQEAKLRAQEAKNMEQGSHIEDLLTMLATLQSKNNGQDECEADGAVREEAYESDGAFVL